MNCGNQVAKNGRKKKRIVATKLLKFWGGIKKKKICGNSIAKLEGKKNCGN